MRFTINKSFVQQDGIYSAGNAVGNCHQGRFPRQTANKVSHEAYRKCKTPNKLLTHINVCKMQCKESAQKGEEEFETNSRNAKSQKPSPVSGRIKSEHAMMKAKISNTGLITPQSHFSRQQTQRLEKIHRLTRTFRERRQQNLRLMAKTKNASSSQ